MEELSKKGLTDMDNSVVIVGGRGWMKVGSSIRGKNGNEKKTIK